MKKISYKNKSSKEQFLPSVMVVGNFKWPWYQEACSLALEKIGCYVTRFEWFKDFHKKVQNGEQPKFHSLLHRLQFRFHVGPIILSINKRLIKTALAKKPEIIWFYNVQLITPSTVSYLKKKIT